MTSMRRSYIISISLTDGAQFLIAGFVCAFMFLSASTVFAKSVTDQQVVNQMLYRGPIVSSSNSCNSEALLNPNVAVTYSADIFKAADMTKVPDGSTVQKGSELILRFKKHEYTDIFWFGTGYFYDSPYGDWLPANVKPPQQCLAKDIVSSTECVGQGCDRTGETRLHIPLAIVPPQKEIQNLNGLSCGSLQNVNGAMEMRCTVTAEVGAKIEPRFEFAETTGKFYFRFWGKIGSAGDSQTTATCHIKSGDPALCGSRNGDPYTYRVNKMTIPFSLTVTQDVVVPVRQPEVLARAVGCEAYEVSVRATDPAAKPIRYGFDWNNNGAIDEWLPSSGYVNSGTRLIVSKKWSPFDQQYVKVRAYNADGAFSEWTETSFFVNDAAFCSDLGVNLIANPRVVSPGDFTTLSWSTLGNPDSCEASIAESASQSSSNTSGMSLSGTKTTSPLSGWSTPSSRGTRSSERNQSRSSTGWSGSKVTVNGKENVRVNQRTTFVITCSKGSREVQDQETVNVGCVPEPREDWSCTSSTSYDNGCGVQQCGSGTVCDPLAQNICSVPTGPHFIDATPGALRKGTTTTVTWSGPIEECVVTGNGNTWTGKSGSQTTNPVMNQVVYTLTCPGFDTKSATVRIIPSYQEI
jgi:hypothetical protein